MKKFLLILTTAIYLLFNVNSFASQKDFFNEAIKLYNNNNFNESKIFFEKDIVYNPKSEKSYLYLAKIYNKQDNDNEHEINLNNVLLLNPSNDEAIYMLTLLKIKQYDYDHAKELIEKFVLICDSFCSKKEEIKEKLKKISPENE